MTINSICCLIFELSFKQKTKIMKALNTKTLSAYTIAKNCSDISDVNAGIEEMKEYFSRVTKPSDTAYIRFAKLNEKLKKLKK